MPPRFWPRVPYNLIQGIRLAHALMETDFEVHIPQEHADKFSSLASRFSARYQLGTADCPVLSDIRISHPAPSTSVGKIERPLVFPHVIVRHCRDCWSETRSVRYSFAGLVTDKRRSLIERWIRANIDDRPIRLSSQESWLSRLQARLSTKLGRAPAGHSRQIGNLQLWSSRRGREFPGKSWDEEYFDLLGRSEFVLCPSGDYVWSYRFFEAVLCGAIPLIEETCPAYDGFRYRSLSDPARELAWSREDANYNYELAVKRITIPLDELNHELNTLLSDPPEPG